MTTPAHRLAVAGLTLALFQGRLHAATVEVTERSEPGGIVSRSSTAETPVEFLSLTAPLEASGYSFTHWTINGVRHNDTQGRAMNPVRFTVYEVIDAVANYLPTGQDSDSDAIPDWCEIHYYSSLTNGAGSDTDADTLTLLEEYRYDSSPLVSNSFLQGGVSMRDSELVTVNLAGFYNWSIASTPAGLITAQAGVASTGSVLITESLGSPLSGYGFGFWTVNGVRQADGSGMALSRVSVAVTTNMTLVANFYPLDQDTDSNGVPDWYGMRYFGSVTNSAGADTDADGLLLSDEYRYDSSPLISNSFLQGGVSMRDSELVTVNLAGFYNWSIASMPAGLITAQAGVAPTGTVLITESLGSPLSGCGFGFWTVNGVRQADGSGMALSRVSVTVTTNMTLVANFYPLDQDTDSNGVPDWYGMRYFGSETNPAGADTDADGLLLSDEYRYDSSPLISNSFLQGGVSMRDSELVTVNLQPFERVKYALVGDILTNWFTIWPTGVLGGAMYSGAISPALGDWDGDGDEDLFLAISNGALHVFENTGSKYTLNYTLRTNGFEAVQTLIGGVPKPVPCLGDWNGDGKEDLVVGGETGQVILVASPGHFSNQNITNSFTVDLVTGRTVPAVLDVTDDNRNDLLVLGEDGLVAVIEHNSINGHPFDLPVSTNDLFHVAVPNAEALTAADINLDGSSDLLMAGSDGRIWEFWRETNSTFTLHSAVWAGSGPGFANQLTLAARDLDGDGDADALAGFEQGGLMFLRDPRLGPPANLEAVGGANSVELSWEPDRQTRVKGYFIYRDVSEEGQFGKLDNNLLLQPLYSDEAVNQGSEYFYRVSAATLAMYPGSTEGTMRESPLSEIVSASVGSVRIWMSDYSAGAGQTAILKVNLDWAAGITATGLIVQISYPHDVLKPMAQIHASSQTVRRTSVSEGMSFSDNGLTATGRLDVAGSAGVAVGGGNLFDIAFWTATNALPGARFTNTFISVQMYDFDGQPVGVDAPGVAVFTVSSAYRLGDVNGDGLVDMDDHQFLMWLLKKDTREPTPQELYAGDMNGDGELSQRDIPLHLRLIHGETVNPE